MAFEKGITVQELFLRAILKTYYQLLMDGQILPTIKMLKVD